MSKLSVWLHKVSDFVSGALDKAPADQHAVITDAQAKFAAAGHAIEAALPILAKVAVDEMLAAIGGGQYVPAFNEILDVLAAEVLSRKTVTATPQPIAANS